MHAPHGHFKASMLPVFCFLFFILNHELWIKVLLPRLPKPRFLFPGLHVPGIACCPGRRLCPCNQGCIAHINTGMKIGCNISYRYRYPRTYTYVYSGYTCVHVHVYRYTVYSYTVYRYCNTRYHRYRYRTVYQVL